MAQQNTDKKKIQPYKRIKPYRFKKSKVFGRRDIVCKNLQKVEDPMGIFTHRSSECYLKKPPVVPQQELIEVCQSNRDCPRGYTCVRGRCIRIPEFETIGPIDVGPMMCNYNGWIQCGVVEVDPELPPEDVTCDQYNNQIDCVQNVDPLFSNGCIWCPGVSGGSCVNLDTYQTYYSENCGLPDEINPLNPTANELGCTNPYAVNYNPNAYAQRDAYGNGCPPDEDCCIYEGTKIDFSTDSKTELTLEPGSYILTFINNDWMNGGAAGSNPFWDTFQSLAHLKHAPYMNAGDFYVTDVYDNDASQHSQIRNCNPACVPSAPNVVGLGACTGTYWYHMTTYVPLTFITQYKYRIFKCGETQVPPPPPPPPGPPGGHILPAINKPGVPT